MSSKLRQYNGSLTPAQTANGIRVARKNAAKLLADAELLLQHDRFERATALAILSIEEASKEMLLREILIARNKNELKKGWRAYRKHTEKNFPLLMASLAANGARKGIDFDPAFKNDSVNRQLFESVKQRAFYTDSVGDCRWVEPHPMNPELARAIMCVARVIASGTPRPFNTEPELEIWLKYMRAALDGDSEQAKKLAVACYTEAESKGILQGDFDTTKLITYLNEDGA